MAAARPVYLMTRWARRLSPSPLVALAGPPGRGLVALDEAGEIGARISKNKSTSTRAGTEKSNQPLPVGTPTNSEKGALASNEVQS